ncbi:Cu(I)-responsive transcriptional regulator [Hydrogenophaga sp.]|uniref:Cu(I)-responsive transcriptional regulator n=1 Tax=Hydrogenophaga sp. TaxID=1904254 RepID=UPI00271865CD|nr:Cu(I)-responsive transcriptional regulator [Hydrogenophaga sp.]MDO8906315.1 Cu(I)-responsive transcriptional regulator [Hydrogenophaga sp.]
MKPTPVAHTRPQTRQQTNQAPEVPAWPVSIGQAAQLSGISPKMLRHYEALGLLGEVARTGSNYRQYNESDVHTLCFIRRSRDMGFGLDAIAELVSLWHDRQRSSASVKKVARKHLGDLDARIEALQTMRRTLSQLLHQCPGDSRPDCPILDNLNKEYTRCAG